MGSVNKCLIVGRMAADPELKSTPSGAAVCNFTVVTNETWKDKDGQKQERAEFHRVTAWREQAELAAKYLAKGREVYVEGKLQTRKYEKDGQERYTTEIIADRIVFLGSGKDGGAQSSGGGARGAASSGGPDALDDSGIPF